MHQNEDVGGIVGLMMAWLMPGPIEVLACGQSDDNSARCGIRINRNHVPAVQNVAEMSGIAVEAAR